MTAAGTSQTIKEYRFGDCRLLVPLREFWRNDELIATEPKVFDLLLYLIRHRDLQHILGSLRLTGWN